MDSESIIKSCSIWNDSSTLVQNVYYPESSSLQIRYPSPKLLDIKSNLIKSKILKENHISKVESAKHISQNLIVKK